MELYRKKRMIISGKLFTRKPLAEQLKIDATTIDMLTELVKAQHPHLVKQLEAISESASGKMLRIYESLDW